MGKKFIFRHMKVPCKSSRAGGAPPRTDSLIGPAACGQCPKPDILKQRAACALALLNLACNSCNSKHCLETQTGPFLRGEDIRCCVLYFAYALVLFLIKRNHCYGDS